MSPIYALSCALFIVAVWVALSRRRRCAAHQLPLPPGPTPWPIAGNIFHISTVHPWLTYHRWATQYGDVMSMRVMGRTLIILDSREAVHDLFEKNPALYSDRPHSIVINDIVGWSHITALLFVNYGDFWRRQRRDFHHGFGPAAVDMYKPVMVHESRAMLQRLLTHPENFKDHIRLNLGAVIMRVTYGVRVSSWDDRCLAIAEAVVRDLLEITRPGAFLVEQLPILKHLPAWFPFAGFHKKVPAWKEHKRALLDDMYDHVKNDIDEGNHTTSMLSTLLSKLLNSEDSELDIMSAKLSTATAYLVGVDTTEAAIMHFIHAMLKHPEAQKKAQEELDRVVGISRLPDFADRDNLHYVNALIKESIRWHPVAPLGLWHGASGDGEYRGYRIPSGSFIVPNVWAILHDPLVYPEPEKFNPERFLDDEGILDVAGKDPLAAFGHGRRMCPGRWFSDAGFYSIVSHILAAFNIAPPLDEEGNEARVDIDVSSDVISTPLGLKCRFIPRSEDVKGLIGD